MRRGDVSPLLFGGRRRRSGFAWAWAAFCRSLHTSNNLLNSGRFRIGSRSGSLRRERYLPSLGSSLWPRAQPGGPRRSGLGGITKGPVRVLGEIPPVPLLPPNAGEVPPQERQGLGDGYRIGSYKHVVDDFH